MSRYKFFAVVLVMLALAPLCVAQTGRQVDRQQQGRESDAGSIHVFVVLPNGAPLNQAAKLTLQTPRGSEFVTYTNFQGQYEYKRVPVGNYDLVAEDESQKFEIATQRVQVMKDLPTVVTFTLKEKSAGTAATPGHASVSVGELDKNVPKEARKEFERGSKAAAAGQTDVAITHLQKAVALYPAFMMAHNDLGAQLLEAGRLAEAATELRAAAKLDPTAYNPRLNLGIVLIRQKQFTAAAQVLDEAIALDPQAPAARLYAGMAYLTLKDFERAEKELRLAYESGGTEYAQALFHLGQLYLSRGNRALALQHFEAYLREMPNAPNAEQVKKLIGTLR